MKQKNHEVKISTKKNHKGNTGRVLEYLKTHKKGITSIQAFEMFGATRLSAIIFNLKKFGYIIESSTSKGKNRYGELVSFSVYKLVGEEK